MRTTHLRKRETLVEPGPPTPIPPDPSPEPGPPVPPLPDPAPGPDPEPDRASALLRLAELPRAMRDEAFARARRGATIRGGIVRLPRVRPPVTSR